jgi:hypothetical protein
LIGNYQNAPDNAKKDAIAGGISPNHLNGAWLLAECWHFIIQSVHLPMENLSTLVCFPTFIPARSAAATVAAANMYADAERRRGKIHVTPRFVFQENTAILDKSSEELSTLIYSTKAIYDTRSADSLFGDYQVRFPAEAAGTWSSRGHYSCPDR